MAAIPSTLVPKGMVPGGADKSQLAVLDRREMQFAYLDGDGCIFVDAESDEPVSLSREQVGELPLYLKQGARANVLFRDGKPLGLEAPGVVELAVADTEPPPGPARHMPATLETGLRLMIPSCVHVGDIVTVDTRTGECLGRAAHRHLEPIRKKGLDL